MTQVLSKLAPISVSCMEHVHPWTHSCTTASAGLLFQAVPESFRIYSAVYLVSRVYECWAVQRESGESKSVTAHSIDITHSLPPPPLSFQFSLLMRGRIPTKAELKKTAMGIAQSTLFLTTNAYTFTAFVCLVRKLLGKFYFPSVTFIPTFLASYCAILLERPSRRNLLTFYVANVATESYWRMAVSRGWVKSIPLGQVIIFSLSSAVCAYLFRMGWHLKQKDSFFGSLRFVVGPNEEFNYDPLVGVAGPSRNVNATPSTRQRPRPKSGNAALDQIIRTYCETIDKLKTARHSCCPHRNSCVHYVLAGGAKLYGVGIGIQLTLSVLFQIQKIFKRPATLKDIIRNKDFTKIAVFLGGYCALFRTVSCVLRHARGKDAPEHALPAGLVAGVAFASYPNVSVALYVMWKTFQFVYAYGHDRGYLPNVPGFGNFLYCFFTATLFHVAMFEPTNLRGSYFKFLDRLSGGRIAYMSRIPLDVYGLESTKKLETVLSKNKIATDLKFLF